MVDATFRHAPTPVSEQPSPKLPDVEPNNIQVESASDDNEPIELRDTGGRSVVLDALNIDDNTNNLPEEDKSKLHDVKQYVMEVMRSKGLALTVHSFKKSLDDIKGDMGLDQEAEPSVILDRVAGVVRAWRNLTFVKDPEEKRKIFFKLANLKSSEEMNREVYRLMENYKVWR